MSDFLSDKCYLSFCFVINDIFKLFFPVLSIVPNYSDIFTNKKTTSTCSRDFYKINISNTILPIKGLNKC